MLLAEIVKTNISLFVVLLLNNVTSVSLNVQVEYVAMPNRKKTAILKLNVFTGNFKDQYFAVYCCCC